MLRKRQDHELAIQRERRGEDEECDKFHFLEDAMIASRRDAIIALAVIADMTNIDYGAASKP